MTSARRVRGALRNGSDRATAADDHVDPAHAAQINRDLKDAEDEARRLGGSISLEAFERDADTFMAELRNRARALKP